MMRALVVSADPSASAAWADALGDDGWQVARAAGRLEAQAQLDANPVDVILIGMSARDCEALPICVDAGYRHPRARVILLPAPDVEVDGSIQAACANVCAYLPQTARAADVAAVAEYLMRRVGAPTRVIHPGVHAVH
jgi:DNA-binding response OmpR family regulator